MHKNIFVFGETEMRFSRLKSETFFKIKSTFIFGKTENSFHVNILIFQFSVLFPGSVKSHKLEKVCNLFGKLP